MSVFESVLFFFYFFIFLFFKLIYLFIFIFWLCWVFISVRGLSPAAASGGHSSSRCAGLSPSRPLPLRSTGSRRAGSAAVAHGLSRSAACGIFPDQGSNPCPLHWQADSQPLRHQGSPSLFFWWNIFTLINECNPSVSGCLKLFSLIPSLIYTHLHTSTHCTMESRNKNYFGKWSWHLCRIPSTSNWTSENSPLPSGVYIGATALPWSLIIKQETIGPR